MLAEAGFGEICLPPAPATPFIAIYITRTAG
jgi:hypothetical protein